MNNDDVQVQQNKLFVGNLPWSINTDQLREMFAEAGEISDAIVLSDKFTGRSKGFGFVTFVNDEDAEKAIEMFNDKEVDGRNIIVNKARPKTERSDRRDFRGGRNDRNGGFNRRRDY